MHNRSCEMSAERRLLPKETSNYRRQGTCYSEGDLGVNKISRTRVTESMADLAAKQFKRI